MLRGAAARNRRAALEAAQPLQGLDHEHDDDDHHDHADHPEKDPEGVGFPDHRM
jgi:hypothetical protein